MISPLCVAAESVWLNTARASITTSELRAHAAVLADDTLEGREAGSRGGRAAAKYILAQLAETPLLPGGSNGQFAQRFRGNKQNLLAVLEGSDPELRGEYLVVGAHYDHVGYGTRRNSYGPWGFIHNGADDNASGVATLLEVIDALAHTDWRPRRSILFAFWDGEEKGLLGSKYWIRNPTVPLANVKLAINIDMVGRLTDGRIEVGGSRTAVGLRRRLSCSTLAEDHWLDFSWEYKDNSDHWSFYRAGVPSTYVHTGLHDDYHRPSDDLEKLNVEGMRYVARYLFEELCEAANADTLPGFRSASRRETPATQRRVEKPLPDFAPRLGITWRYVYESPAHVLVRQVPTGSAAWQAGLRAGDRILEVDGLPITCPELFPAVVLRADSGVTLTVQGASPEGSPDEPDNLQRTIEVKLRGQPVRLGMSWRFDPADPNSVYVTRVVAGSPAERAGIRLYDRIRMLDNKTVQGQDSLLARIITQLDLKQQLLLEIESRGRVRDVTVSLQLPTAGLSDPTL